ncbi:hypothetical protein, partial [Klebsiella pneumoniae]|uniref:hypothetical protein n=1 Tax=Klebsiella pneumoniae TaxID=573 RepID=UPI0034560F07
PLILPWGSALGGFFVWLGVVWFFFWFFVPGPPNVCGVFGFFYFFIILGLVWGGLLGLVVAVRGFANIIIY